VTKEHMWGDDDCDCDSCIQVAASRRADEQETRIKELEGLVESLSLRMKMQEDNFNELSLYLNELSLYRLE